MRAACAEHKGWGLALFCELLGSASIPRLGIWAPRNSFWGPSNILYTHSSYNINVQGRPKLWANFKALIGIFSQSVGPSLAIWASPVHFSLYFLVPR
jgi:hypothetical protein